VLADEVELTRVISNLVENARRYGKTPSTGVADVTIQAQANNDAVLIKVRDHGAGVEPALLSQLTKPFFRGDAARTSAAGAGPGPVDRGEEHRAHGRHLRADQHAGGGLAAHIRCRAPCRPKPPKPGEMPAAGSRPEARSGLGLQRCSKTPARASIARPSPTGPSFSAVLAFTLTCSSATPSAGDALAHGGMCGASFGACAITVLSTLPISQPAARTRRAASASSTDRIGAAKLLVGVGKCRPMSPSPARPAAHR
jgi:hypothetical protein